ncbi:MAG: DUF3971 domain-containing protein [Nitrospirae bacterium]|nr:MAG: DUF3971 domain-containing protein [Nitrospirota bacterium]
MNRRPLAFGAASGIIATVWNPRRKLAWLVLVPVAVLAAVALSLPLILNTADYQALLVEQAELQLGRKVTVKRATVEVFPYVRIALDDVVIKEPDGTTQFLFADHFFIDLRVFPLLQRKVLARRILLDKPKMAIRRGAAGILNISDLFSQTAQPSDFTIPMLGEEIAIADGEFVFEDSFGVEAPRTVTLRHVTTTLTRAGVQLGFKFHAALPHDNTEATFTVTGQVSREALVGARPGGKAVGRLEAKGLNLSQLAAFLNNNPVLRSANAPMNLTGAFEYRWAKGERALAIKELNVTGAGATITGTVTLSKLFTPQVEFVSSLTTTPFRLESLVQGLPEETVQAYALGFLKQGQASGSVRLVSLQVGWSPEQARRLTVKGEVNLLGGSAVVGSHHVPVSEVNGRFLFDPDRIAIEELTGKYGLADVTEGRGEVTRLADNPQLALDIKGRLSAQELAVVVARFAPKALLPLGPAGLTKLQGEAAAAVKLEGPLNRLDELRVAWGLEAKDVGFTDRRLSLPFAGVRGRVRSIPRGVLFDRLAGRVGHSPIVLDGEIAVRSDEKAHYALIVSGQADTKELLGVTMEKPSKKLSVEGTAGFGLSISGRTGELRGIGRADLGQTGISHVVGFRKPNEVPASVEFDLQLDQSRRVKVNRFAAAMPPFKILTKGTLSFDRDRSFDLEVRIPPVAIRALPKGLLAVKTSFNAGSFQAQFTAAGPLDNWWAAKLKGQAAITHASFKIEGLAAPVEDLTATFSFVEDRLTVEGGTLKIADSRITATGDIRGWRGIPRIQAAFDSPGLDLALLVPEGDRSLVRVAMEALTSGAKLSATATIRNGRYHGVLFDEIQAKVSGGDDAIVLDPVTGRMGKGTITGQTRVALPPGKPAAVESTLHLKGIAVEPVFHSVGIMEPPFTGSLTLDGAIRGDGTHPKGPAPTLNGDVKVLVADGRFRKLSATSKIAGLLNLTSQLAGKADVTEQGMPFDCVSGRIVIKNGIAEVQNYRVDSPVLKITGAGTYDIPNDQYDMVMVVTPFGSYEGILQSIPLFGKLFAGEREGFTTAFFEIKGPLVDPKVTWLPMKSVGSGLTGLGQLAFDLMKNIVLLPKELIAPADKGPRTPCSAQ